MQKLLGEVPRTKGENFTLPKKFDARAADSRIVLVALSSLHPLNHEDGKLIDIASLVEEYDLNAFQKIIPIGTKVAQSSSNRILLPPISRGVRKELVELISREGLDSKILRSHCIDKNAANFLINRDLDEFLSCRGNLLKNTVDSFGSRLAAWGMSDRPSINFILQQTGEET
jgi:hypothetical protein